MLLYIIHHDNKILVLFFLLTFWAMMYIVQGFDLSDKIFWKWKRRILHNAHKSLPVPTNLKWRSSVIQLGLVFYFTVGWTTKTIKQESTCLTNEGLSVSKLLLDMYTHSQSCSRAQMFVELKVWISQNVKNVLTQQTKWQTDRRWTRDFTHRIYILDFFLLWTDNFQNLSKI